MSLYQEHRFFAGSFLLVFALGFCGGVKPLLDELSNLRDQEKIAALQLEEKKQALRETGLIPTSLQTDGIAKIKKSLLENVLQLAERNRCEIRSLQTDPLHIKMNFDNDFVSFYRFIEMILRQRLPLQLNHFSLTGQGEITHITLAFSVFPALYERINGLVKNPNYNSCCVRDPFHEVLVLRNEKRTFVDLEQLRYVGYLSEAGKSGALILLPDGRVSDVYPGSYLAKTTWRVLSIHLQYLLLLDEQQNKQGRLLRAK